MEGKLKGQVAIVTGGASGIGRAIAEVFAREGAQVVVADLSAAGAEQAAAALQGAGAQALALTVDVRDAAAIQAMVQATVARFGGLDILVNNAGTGEAAGPIHETPDDSFDRVIAINLRGVFLGMKHAVPAMLRRGGGRIINIASVAGVQGLMGAVAYSASKAAVIQMTKVAAKEYAAAKILVNTISPGWVDTPMVEQVQRERGEKFSKAMMRSLPIGRHGRPEEIAAGALFLASDATFMTGANLILDGGITA